MFSERWGKEEEARLLLGAALKLAGCWWDDFLPELHSIWTKTYKAARDPTALAYTERRLLHWLDYRLHRFGHPAIIAHKARTHGIGYWPCRLGAMVTEIDLETVKSGRMIVTPPMMDTLVKDHRNCGVDRVMAKLQSSGWK
ncbi:hypothetical protein EX30DRAFT_340518 [Ascodesmis nigricans]|uniref:Uncharacterized protein n=1 Tax=Ascodesmis nigricans TaxID=341454 RepID=A0A4V6RHF5_9PEZI|nr:hypothetical protein EX30DRAFT_340518 [Ascodesmis nigricans]